MIPHSFIVCALLTFSLVARAGSVPLDVNPAEVTAELTAVLHKEVGLQQGGGAGRDVVEAQVVTEDCKAANHCPSDSIKNPPKIQTLHEWLVVPQNSSGANPLIAILLIFIATFFYLRRSPSTK